MNNIMAVPDPSDIQPLLRHWTMNVMIKTVVTRLQSGAPSDRKLKIFMEKHYGMVTTIRTVFWYVNT